MIVEGLRDGRSSKPHHIGQFVFLIRLIIHLQFFIFLLLLKIELLHDTREGMVTVTVVAFIKHHKRIISQLDVPSPQAIEEHLRNHYGDGGLLHLIQKLLPVVHVGLNSFSLGDSLVIIPFSVNTNDLIGNILRFPVQLIIFCSQSLTDLRSKVFILEDADKSLLDGFRLLLD